MSNLTKEVKAGLLSKKASAYAEVGLSTLGGLPLGALTASPALPLAMAAGAASIAAGTAGTVHGVASPLPTNGKAQLKELEYLRDNKAVSMFPGETASRLQRRQRLVHALLADNKPVKMSVAERKQLKQLGVDPDQINDIANKKSQKKSNIALHTWLSGINPLNIVASPVAALAAALTKGENPEQRASFVNDPNKVTKTWLIPGYGLYNQLKDIGLSNRLEDIERVIRDLKLQGKKEEAAKYEKLLKQVR